MHATQLCPAWQLECSFDADTSLCVHLLLGRATACTAVWTSLARFSLQRQRITDSVQGLYFYHGIITALHPAGHH
jgi:hypothetical protein